MSHHHNHNTLSWGLRRLHVKVCWQAGWTGAGVRVGHLDTGVEGTHEGLAGRVAAFAAFDDDGEIIPGASPHDTGIHGTHTAGIICGGTTNGQAIGVAPDAQICAGAVIEGGHVLARVLSGMDWIATCGVRVVCLSLGVPGYHPVFEIALARLRRQGVLVVCPIGNSRRGAACSPAIYPSVLAVGAIDQADQVAHFSSNTQHAGRIKPDLVAPGVAVASAEAGGQVGVHDGTSMAAAFVAGVAALLFQARPDATADEVEHALLSSAEPLPQAPSHRQGRGLICPRPAIQLLLEGKTTPCLHHNPSIHA